MRNQIEVWKEEHANPKLYPILDSTKPSACVKDFAVFLVSKGLQPKETRILDLGCGKGRNSIYLASQGFQVTGVDCYWDGILSVCSERAKQARVTLNLNEVDLTHEDLPFQNEYFHAVVDCYGSMVLREPARKRLVEQASLKLQKGGYYLFFGIGLSDLSHMVPGPEASSVILENGQFEKRYSEHELGRTFLDKFNLDKNRNKIEKGITNYQDTELPTLQAIFQKP